MSRITIELDHEMQAALAELVASDGTETTAIRNSLLAEVKRRRRLRMLLETETDSIDQAHLDWADEALDRQGVDR